MTRVEQKIAAIEEKLKYVNAPDPIIIFQNKIGEPERSIKRFYEKYPDYEGAIVALPEKEKI